MSMPDVPGFVYRRFPPSPRLLPYVEHHWLVSAPEERSPRREILIPNGRPMLLLSFATSSVRIDPLRDDQIANGNTVSEVTSQPFVIEQSGEARFIGMQFRPYGLAAFVPGPRRVNRLIPLAGWLGESEAAALLGSLSGAEFGPARVERLDRLLQTKLADIEPATLRLLDLGVTAIEQADQEVRIEDLARQLNVHYTTLYRAFRKHVGLGPKQFGEIVRYYRFVGSILTSAGIDPQALLAGLQGYYDQSHADKEFRRFTGVTPTSFRTTLNSIARLMHHNAWSQDSYNPTSTVAGIVSEDRPNALISGG